MDLNYFHNSAMVYLNNNSGSGAEAVMLVSVKATSRGATDKVMPLLAAYKTTKRKLVFKRI
jgi:hypothetical protein